MPIEVVALGLELSFHRDVPLGERLPVGARRKERQQCVGDSALPVDERAIAVKRHPVHRHGPQRTSYDPDNADADDVKRIQDCGMRIALAALLVASACGGQHVASRVPAEPPSTPTPSASAAPSPTAPRGSPPVSTSIAPEAGVLFAAGPGDWIYPPDRPTGAPPRRPRPPPGGRLTR